MDRIEAEIRISMGPRRIVAAFFDRTDLGIWWKTSGAAAEPRPGGTYRVEWPPAAWDLPAGPFAGRFHGTVTAHDPVSGFTLTSCRWEESHGSPAGPTTLRIGIESKINKTRVQVEHDGFAAGTDGERCRRLFEAGWPRWLESLRLFLEEGTA